MTHFYCISVIAKTANRTDQGSLIQTMPDFYHDGRPFLLLADIDFDKLKKHVANATEFSLILKTSHANVDYKYLCLFFSPSPQTDFSVKQIRSKYELIGQFFYVDQKSIISQTDDIMCSENSKILKDLSPEPISIQDIYSLLRQSHLNDQTPTRVCDEKTPTGLGPALRFYQNDAVNWMLDRELSVSYFPSEFCALRCRNLAVDEYCIRGNMDSNQLYYNPRTMEICDHWPGNISIPSGGILADEMGLGKTVEMLALMLCNPLNAKQRPEEESLKTGFDSRFPKKKSLKVQLMCVCHNKGMKNLIECRHCGLYQHIACVGKFSTSPLQRNTYRCPACWENQEPIDSGATFIVSPPAIKMQWQAEIHKHTIKKDFKVLVYNGFKNSGWISPADLATYDVVLTDYNVMGAEIHFVGNKRNSISRKKPQYIRPVSPLPLVRWWRVCLDEAQMVEMAVNLSSRMVKLLPAVHRWAVSGTPIEKSIDNMHGLLYFLDVYPYTDVKMWQKITEPLQQSDATPLINVLSRIMWRTCKSTVWDQIGIPPQSEVLHPVELSDLEVFFYNSQHSQCYETFRKNTLRLSNELLFKLNPHVMKKVMEPLRKLRQDCTVPTLLSKTNNSKRLLSPEELQLHLAGKHEIECKSQLRSIASTLNGLAALYIIKKDFKAAVGNYNSVLRWASDYTGTICVDTLLQVHALQNLIDILPFTSEDADELISIHRSALDQLETKYMANCSLLIQKVGEQKLAAEEAIGILSDKMSERSTEWWYDALEVIDDREQLIERIRIEFEASSVVLENVSSISGISYILVTWLTDLEKQRQDLQSAFYDLEYFSANIKPRSQLNSSVAAKIEHLVQTALACHLDKNKLDSDEDHNTEMQKKLKTATTTKLCQLCVVKHTLMTYECNIFAKKFYDDERNTVGTWNPTCQENILRVFLSQLKRERSSKAQEIAKDGEIHMQIIEALKNEFKEYSKYWVEINYAAAAYDELNMCKSRLKSVDPEAIKDQPDAKSIMNIPYYEVHLTMDEHRVQLIEAERGFQRAQGTLKYLKHLEKNSAGPETCPICKQIPENKYCVLECGHHMCMVCLIQIKKMHKTYVDCCMCRRKQTFKEIYFVTTHQRNGVSGDFSSKICEIVLTLLELRQKDDRVKVILFSHWETILNIIASALTSNGLEFRKKSNPFNKSVDDFKNEELNVTCLLLPLASGSKGVNLIEATHVFLVEPILNPAEELQAIGRVHRIGQTKPTFVHRFIVQNTIEETIHRTISNDESGTWASKQVTIDELEKLFALAQPSINGLTE